MNRWVHALLVLAALTSACASDKPPARARSTATATAQPTQTPEPQATSPPDPFALAETYAPRTPRAVAAILQRDDLTAPETAKRHQAAYRQLVRKPEWQEEAYAKLQTSDVQRAQVNVEAGDRLRRLTPPKTELPPWRIVPPPPADELRAHYDAAAKEFGIDWSYLAAIHLVETRLGRIRGTSDAGAKGPMQFLPSTWDAYGEGDIEDAHDAIRAAGRYLKAHGAPGDMHRALFAYNHSDHYVRAVELYASRMDSDWASYYHWDVYYRTVDGDALLYEGWPSR
jgi:membrane-bound lytic murein transglycosylase B